MGQRIDNINEHIASKANDLVFNTPVSLVINLLKKLWKESKPDIDRTYVNRFKYDADNVRLFGRDEELAFLWEFCHADSHFSWFAISGEGGSGKTRLAHTLGHQLQYSTEKRGWKYHKVDYAYIDGLLKAKQALEKDPKNTLIVLDYVKWHTDSISDWLYGLWHDWNNRDLKIRVLLVDRDAVTPDELRWEHNVLSAQYRPNRPEPFLDRNNLMRLRPLDDADMVKVVEDFAASTGQAVNVPLVVKKLKKVDPQLQRPLYALFLTDAYITGENLLEWDREDALWYVYNKEISRIQHNVAEVVKDKQELSDMEAIVFRVLLLATLLGGITWDFFASSFPLDTEILREHSTKTEPTGQRLLALFLGIPYSKQVPLLILPLMPDLMGEFFAIQQLFSLDTEDRHQIISIAGASPERMEAFADRALQDYCNLIIEFNLYKDICKDFPFSLLVDLAKENKWTEFVEKLTNIMYMDENYTAYRKLKPNSGDRFLKLFNCLCSLPPPFIKSEKLSVLGTKSFQEALHYKFVDGIGSFDAKARCNKCGTKGLFQGWRDIATLDYHDRYVIICPNCYYHFTFEEFAHTGSEEMYMIYDYDENCFVYPN